MDLYAAIPEDLGSVDVGNRLRTVCYCFFVIGVVDIAVAYSLYRWLEVHRAQHTLVEAAGGWRVPLLAHPGGFIEAVALTRHLDADVIVVAADRLGVLSHTRLTVEAIRADGCRVTGVVLNRRPGVGSDASQASNLEDLQLLLDVPVVVFPTLDPADPEALLSAGQAVLSALPMRILRA